MVSTSKRGLDGIIGDRSMDRNKTVYNIIRCEEENMGITLQYTISQLLANSTLDPIDLTYDTHVDSEQEYKLGRGIVNILFLTESCEVPPSYIDSLNKEDYRKIAERALVELEINGIIRRGNHIITIYKDLYEIKKELKEKYGKHIEETERKSNYTTGRYIY